MKNILFSLVVKLGTCMKEQEYFISSAWWLKEKYRFKELSGGFRRIIAGFTKK